MIHFSLLFFEGLKEKMRNFVYLSIFVTLVVIRNKVSKIIDLEESFGLSHG